jgi:hypothetical protein
MSLTFLIDLSNLAIGSEYSDLQARKIGQGLEKEGLEIQKKRQNECRLHKKFP